MVKKIIWTDRADKTFTRILEFYIVRNGSKTYSRKLNKNILSVITIISKQPFLGIKTDHRNIRVLIKGFFKIFYQVDEDKLIIHLVWDCRQNQETINISFVE